MSNADSPRDSVLVEVGQVKGLDLPDTRDITHLQDIRFQHSRRSDVPLEATSYWDRENDDDFVILRTEAEKGSRMNFWLKFIIAMIKWQFKDMKRVSLAQTPDFS